MNVIRRLHAAFRDAALTAAVAVLAVAALVQPSATEAHHSPAAFDTRQSVTVTGTVTRYEWFNPHVYITIEQRTEDGSKKEWEVECSPPSMMRRLGWSKETLRLGDALTITGSPGRDPGSHGLLAGTIKRADETLMQAASFAKQLAPSADAPKFVAKSLAGTWLAQPTITLIAQLSFPQASQLTAEGARLLKSFDEKEMSPAVNCVPHTAPITMVLPDTKHVSLRDGVVVIRSEFDGAQRTIHLDQTTHEGAIPSHQGHSIGKWEGDTLVIDTTNFAYHGLGNGLGVPSSPSKHLVERLTRSADGTSLMYRFELKDPRYLKAPRTAEMKWAFRPDMPFAPEPCNLDNARRFIRH
jgi:Family of unknown function (DUF6152)